MYVGLYITSLSNSAVDQCVTPNSLFKLWKAYWQLDDNPKSWQLDEPGLRQWAASTAWYRKVFKVLYLYKLYFYVRASFRNVSIKLINTASPFLFSFLQQAFVNDLCRDKLLTILWRYFRFFSHNTFTSALIYHPWHLASSLCFCLTFCFLRLCPRKIIAVKNCAHLSGDIGARE